MPKRNTRKIQIPEDRISEAMSMFAEGKKHGEVIEFLGISRATLARRLRDDDEFRLLYLQAKEDAADALIDKIMDIMGDDSWRRDGKQANAAVQKQKLKIDTLKWLAGKLKPKQYGDKIDITGNVTHDISPLAQLRKLEAPPEAPPKKPFIDAEIVENTPITEDDCF